MRLSIIIPVYNSENILPLLVKAIFKNLKNKIPKYEIILVNDSSRDKSWNKIVDLSKKYKFIKGIDLSKIMDNIQLSSQG